MVEMDIAGIALKVENVISAAVPVVLAAVGVLIYVRRAVNAFNRLVEEGYTPLEAAAKVGVGTARLIKDKRANVWNEGAFVEKTGKF